MARSNESPMDFSWDNKYGPIDPTSPFSKLATMKRMSWLPNLLDCEGKLILSQRQDRTAFSTHRKRAASRACANPILSLSSSLSHRPTERRRSLLHANPSTLTSPPAPKTYRRLNRPTMKTHLKLHELLQISQLRLKSPARNEILYSTSTDDSHPAPVVETQLGRNSVMLL